MGRPEVPIPENRPMKAMAEFLRQLRRTAGAPSYRRLGELVYVEQQSLSQTANGRWVGWGRVLLYVQALRQHNPQAVTTTELATLKHLHQLGERIYQQTTTRHLRRRQNSSVLWSQVGVATASAARHRPAGHWNLTPGVTDTIHLDAVRTGTGLFSLLHQVAARHGINLDDPSQSQPRPAGFSWFGKETPPHRPIPQLRHPEELTTTSLSAVVRACGGTEGDCVAWLAAWERIRRATRRDDVDGHPRHLPPAESSSRSLPASRRLHASEMVSTAWPGGTLRRPAALGS